MDTDETQILLKDVRDSSLKPVSDQLIGAAFEVHDIPGYGFPERVCQRAMQVELLRGGIPAELEPPVKVQFKGGVVGDYPADLLAADKILVELKTDSAYQSLHEAQLLNELRGTGIKPGYLINFGRDRVEYKRMVF